MASFGFSVNDIGYLLESYDLQKQLAGERIRLVLRQSVSFPHPFRQSSKRGICHSTLFATSLMKCILITGVVQKVSCISSLFNHYY